MDARFFPVVGGGSIVATLQEPPFDSGGEGRVYRASHQGSSTYCVKAIPDATPGAASAEIAAIASLVGHFEVALQKEALPTPVRHTLNALMQQLPTHIGMDYLEDGLWLLFLRKFDSGSPLHARVSANQPRPGILVRYEIARRLVGSLTALQLYGYIHLDPYPDNICVTMPPDGPASISLIDLESLGIARTKTNGTMDWRADSFVRQPRAFGKPDVWPLPPWYPRPTNSADPRPVADGYTSAAAWQALSVLFYILTWGAKPFSWLAPRDFQTVTLQYFNGSAPDAMVKEVLGRHDKEALAELDRRLGGDSELLLQLITWFRASFLDHRFMPQLKEIQDRLSLLARI